IWPGKIKPETRTNCDYTQIDIAPTILDLLGIRTRNHFIGKSVFCSSKDRLPILLTQPYSEGYIAVIERPWKLVRTISDGREYLYNLSQDPDELKDLRGACKDVAL